MDEFRDSYCMDQLLQRLRDNDPAARSELIVHTLSRLKRLSRRMLHNYPGIHQIEETDDILQRLVIRLQKALLKVSPDTVAGYFALANQNLKWILKELARSKLARARSFANVFEDTEKNKSIWEATDPHCGPSSCAEWVDFYDKIDQLPKESRDVFELLWFQGLDQKQAAKILDISVSTLIRRWVTAKLELRRLLKDDFPEFGEK